MVECQRHEMLLNLAFADAGPFWLLCPYDRAALDGAVIEEAQRSHPFVGAADRVWRSAGYLGSEAASATLDGPLPKPPGRRRRLDFGIGQLRGVRKLVLEQAAAAGFDAARAADFVLAVNEAATNSLLHGGGAGTIQVWDEEDALVCEIRDQGHISRPLAGRERPAAHTDGGRGLWMVNELCDLAQLRSSPGGTVFRLQMRRS